MSSAAELLLDTARRGELHHAVILHGPSPEALRALALQVAKALNCLHATTGDDCLSCSRIDRRIHPDVHFIEVAGEKKMISIEQIREIVSGATMRPYEGRTKVFIVDPADALSASGSNALLKTLEEPSRDTSFLLLTRTPDRLLPTIRSRSQSIHVGDIRPGRGRLEQIATLLPDETRSTLETQIRAALARFADRRETAALLGIAAAVASADAVNDAMALLAAILLENESIDRQKGLDAADTLMTAVRGLDVNADPRLLVESALARLVT
jgi:DNA polymerase-3 subunit delta'